MCADSNHLTNQKIFLSDTNAFAHGILFYTVTEKLRSTKHNLDKCKHAYLTHFIYYLSFLKILFHGSNNCVARKQYDFSFYRTTHTLFSNRFLMPLSYNVFHFVSTYHYLHNKKRQQVANTAYIKFKIVLKALI